MLVDPMSPDVLVWLVNEWGSVPRAAAGEDQAPYPDTELLAALLAGSGVRSCPPAALTTPALRQVADRLHRVFAAAELSERVDLVAGLLADTPIRPTLDLEQNVADRPSATWQVDDASHVLLAAAALTLRHQLAEHDPDRIGVCSGRRCADAFIDASPAGQRRFCSLTCQNRTRVAAWRQRQSSQPQSSQPQSSQPKGSQPKGSQPQSSQPQSSQPQN
jgi:predicted RNA-binding Zn ribbon-like protein